MKRMKSVILAVLTIVVILSLVGCVKLQKASEDKDAGDKKADDKQIAKEDAKKDVKKEEKAKEPANVTEAKKPEKKETTPEKKETKPAPTVDAEGLPIKEVTEGNLVSFPNLKAVDPDGDPITYTFTSPLDEKGNWQTSEGDAGEYVITITASDGKNEVSQDIKLVVKMANALPTITLSSTAITVDEGETISLDAQAQDADNDEVTLTFSGWMDSATRETTFDDAGTHTVTITASDGKGESTQEVTITVNNVNRAPKLGEIAEITVKEGEKVFVEADATDPDGDEITISFGSPIGTSGSWKTEPGDAGTYEIDVTASDGELTDIKKVKINVQSLNNPPVITLALETINVEEGEIVNIDADITDPENDELTITYSGWMTSSSYQTDYDDAGTHTVTITATDGINTATKDVTVNVVDKNRPPVFDPGAFN